MKLILDLLKRFWQRSPSDQQFYGGRMGDSPDRSSMADFVRILQTHDRDRSGSTQA